MDKRAKIDAGPFVPGCLIFCVGILALAYSDVRYPSVALIVIGLCLLVWTFIKKHQADQLLNNGNFVWGTITGLRKLHTINMLGAHPSVADITYIDASGNTHYFISQHMYRVPISFAVGKKVKVYIYETQYKPYYVDIESCT